MRHEFKILSFNISSMTGIRKQPVPTVRFVEEHGIEGDAHAGKLPLRQVSLLSMDEVKSSKAYANAQAKGVTLKAGDFAENISTSGVELHKLPLGTKVYIGDAELEVSQIGKTCHVGCEITKIIGDCIMPSKGIFVRVLKGGSASHEDSCYYEL
ncbi:MAG: MOSC domain-containing protein [Brevinema sp.]